MNEYQPSPKLYIPKLISDIEATIVKFLTPTIEDMLCHFIKLLYVDGDSKIPDSKSLQNMLKIFKEKDKIYTHFNYMVLWKKLNQSRPNFFNNYESSDNSLVNIFTSMNE